MRPTGQPGPAASRVEAVDLDIDGYDELLVSTPGQVVAIKPSEGGGIGSWDVRAVRHALASVMRRRPEAYHDTLRAADSGEVEEQEAGEGAVSIHDLIKVNEPGISKRLWYDAYERRSGLRAHPADRDHTRTSSSRPTSWSWATSSAARSRSWRWAGTTSSSSATGP